MPLSLIQLAMRIGVGAVFFKAGLLKYNSWEFTVKLFEDEYQVPLLDPTVAARIAMIQELTIPILLFLGLATRVATVPLLGMIAVIQTFVYPNAWTEHLVWASMLVFLLTRGPGRSRWTTWPDAGSVMPRRLCDALHDRCSRARRGRLNRLRTTR